MFRDLFQRMFGGSSAKKALDQASKSAGDDRVKTALKERLLLQRRLNQLKALKEQKKGSLSKPGDQLGSKLQEQLMLEHLREARKSFAQQSDFLQKQRERNQQMLDTQGKTKSREERMKKVMQEIEKFENDFFSPKPQSQSSPTPDTRKDG